MSGWFDGATADAQKLQSVSRLQTKPISHGLEIHALEIHGLEIKVGGINAIAINESAPWNIFLHKVYYIANGDILVVAVSAAFVFQFTLLQTAIANHDAVGDAG